MVKAQQKRVYEDFVAYTQQGLLCRSLWLVVIQQAIDDSLSANAQNKRDLPETVKSEWWTSLFELAGIEHEAKRVGDMILANLAREPDPKRHYPHATTRPQDHRVLPKIGHKPHKKHYKDGTL